MPDVGDRARVGFLDTLARAGTLAHDAGVTLCLETGSEPADVLAACLDELASPGLMVNFDLANLPLCARPRTCARSDGHALRAPSWTRIVMSVTLFRLTEGALLGRRTAPERRLDVQGDR